MLKLSKDAGPLSHAQEYTPSLTIKLCPLKGIKFEYKTVGNQENIQSSIGIILGMKEGDLQTQREGWAPAMRQGFRFSFSFGTGLT